MTEPIIGGTPLKDLEKMYEWRDENIQLKSQVIDLKAENLKLQEKILEKENQVKEYQLLWYEEKETVEKYKQKIENVINFIKTD
jgi:hypothetical protein